MKAIIIDDKGELFAICDSAIGRDVMPLFLPAGDNWIAEGRIAYRISRLGKCVSEKYALRYVDAIGTVLLLHPQGKFESWLSVMDSALTTGQWLKLTDDKQIVEWTYGDERNVIEASSESWQTMLAHAISHATGLATIKTGDIILPPLPAVSFIPQPNKKIEASINSIPSLSVKLK